MISFVMEKCCCASLSFVALLFHFGACSKSITRLSPPLGRPTPSRPIRFRRYYDVEKWSHFVPPMSNVCMPSSGSIGLSACILKQSKTNIKIKIRLSESNLPAQRTKRRLHLKKAPIPMFLFQKNKEKEKNMTVRVNKYNSIKNQCLHSNLIESWLFLVRSSVVLC